MKAARLVGPRQFEILDAEVPSPREGQCLIRLEKFPSAVATFATSTAIFSRKTITPAGWTYRATNAPGW